MASDFYYKIYSLLENDRFLCYNHLNQKEDKIYEKVQTDFLCSAGLLFLWRDLYRRARHLPPITVLLP